MGQRTTGRRANAPTRCLRVPCGPLCGQASGQRAYAAACRSSPPPRAARARSSSCSRPSRCIAATRPAGTASTAHTSRARLRAPLPLLRRRFLLPLPLPRERERGFVDDHRFSTKSIAARQERVDESSVSASVPGRQGRSRARAQGGSEAEQASRIWCWAAIAPSKSNRYQPCENPYRR